MTQRKGQALIKRIFPAVSCQLAYHEVSTTPEHLLHLIEDKLYVVFEIDDSMSGCTIAPMLIEQSGRKGRDEYHLRVFQSLLCIPVP